MNLPRVVLDTNVVVSAVISAAAYPGQIVELIARRRVLLFLSEPIIEEYASVLARPKFQKLDRAHMAQLFRLLAHEATFVAPRIVVTESPDEADNRFLECAQAARAHYLVTGNRRHFPERWKTTHIVTPREFFDRLDRKG